jgi:hypothetical protein
MITDLQNELTASTGQAVTTGTLYGSKPYDLKVPAFGVDDPAVGHPLHVMCQALTNAAGFTSVDIALINDTDGLGGSATVLETKNFPVASLTVANGVQRVGVVSPGAIGAATKRYLTARFTVTGTGTGQVLVWLQKGDYVTPANASGTL